VLPPAVLASVPVGPYPHLRSVCLAGEACPASLVATWSSDGRTVINGYGPTEATVGATFSQSLRPGSGNPPIGRPVAGTRAYVLDARLRPVPTGVPGELYLAGAGLARGYHGRPAATAERFVADLHATRPGRRMYRTGDIARWRADGQLEFISRADGQISRHGLRIEPGEVESVLAMHDSVAQVVVVAHEDGQHRQRLVGYLVPATGHAPDHDVLRRHAMSMLPAYMVPDVLVTLDSLPVTAHGKLDRTALPAPPSPELSGPSAADGPESALCEFFAELLGTPAGPRDDFFDLGGDSIMAIQLASRARDAGLRFTPQDVFASRTPMSLAEVARTAKPADAVPDPGTGQFPLTPMMHWWREQGGQAGAFTMSALLPVPAGTSHRQVAAALRALAAIHGALRMRLVQSPDGTWGLEVAPDQPGSEMGLHVTDAAGLPLAELRQAAIKAAGDTRLDPGAGQMAAATWFDRGAQEDGRLLLTLHHLAADGVSWRVVAEELPGLLSGQRQPRPEGTSFARWARLLTTESTRTDRVAAELPAWERVLSGPPARLVADGQKLAGPRGTFTASLPADVTDRLLTTVTAGFRCGPQDIMLAALLAAAIRWREDGQGTGLLVDVEGHGREASSSDIDLTRTVGWFTTQYPVRLDAGVAGCADFWLDGPASGRALKQVKEQMRGVPADGLGYGLLRYLNRETASRLAALAGPDIRFNYLGRFAAGDSAGVELIGPAQSAPPLAHAVELDAVVEVTAEGPRLVANWSYAERLMTAARARELGESWFAALAVIAGNADKPWSGGASSSDFPLVDLTQQEIDAFELDLDQLTGDELL
jgi:non-ribosomal peptide synthase protein (TIGR01720 family)